MASRTQIDFRLRELANLTMSDIAEMLVDLEDERDDLKMQVEDLTAEITSLEKQL